MGVKTAIRRLATVALAAVTATQQVLAAGLPGRDAVIVNPDQEGLAGEADAQGDSARDIFRQFWPYTRGDRRRLLLSGIFAITVSCGEIGT